MEIENGVDEEMLNKLVLQRHALHASRMSLTLQDCTYGWSSDIPDDMQGLLSRCEIV